MIVFNGIIYNHAALREELQHCGQTFASTSDTEAILKDYAVWGERVVERLLGMFAFCVVEVATGRASFHSVVPAPRTILAGVRKLPPATTLVVEPDGPPDRAVLLAGLLRARPGSRGLERRGLDGRWPTTPSSASTT